MTKKLSKKELLKVIEQLEKNPNDKVQIFTDMGLLTAGAVAGGILAAEIGASAIFFGLVAVAAPVGLVVGGAALGGLALVGVKKWFVDGTAREGKRQALLETYYQQLQETSAKERASNIKDYDKTKFITLLKEPIALDLIKPQEAQELIEAVEGGQIPLPEAYQLVMNVLNEGKK